MQDLKNTVVAIAVLQIVLASTVGALLFVKGEEIKGIDRRVLGIRNEQSSRVVSWKSEGSFMEV